MCCASQSCCPELFFIVRYVRRLDLQDSYSCYILPSLSLRQAEMFLPTNDPVADTGFVLLIIVIFIAIFLLTVTARRAAEDDWNTVRAYSKYLQLQRKARPKIPISLPPEILRERLHKRYRQSKRRRDSLRISCLRLSHQVKQGPQSVRRQLSRPPQLSPLLFEDSQLRQFPLFGYYERPVYRPISEAESSYLRLPQQRGFDDLYDNYHKLLLNDMQISSSNQTRTISQAQDADLWLDC